MRIVFMGTPEFAVASLDALVKAGKKVVAVVTAPDRPAGRGQKLKPSAVKTYAIDNGIPVLQPERLKDPEFIAQLSSLKADLQVVVAFRMLPEIVWDMPPLGTVNLHASLLPHYRGAAPINHVLINGETETGVTTFLLQHEIDTGNILFAEKVAIGPDETAGELHDKLMEVGATILVKTVNALEQNSVTPKPQSSLIEGEQKELKSAPKIFREHCHLDWNQKVDDLHNLIRGLSPYPAAFTELNGKTIKIFRSAKEYADSENVPAPGTPTSDNKTFLKFSAQDGFIHVLELQAEGKKKMEVVDFLRGVKI